MNERFDPESLPVIPDVQRVRSVDTYSLKPGDTIVITVTEDSAEWHARLLAEQMVRFLADKQLEGVHVLVLAAGQQVAVKSEAEMRRAGWVRAVPEWLAT